MRYSDDRVTNENEGGGEDHLNFEKQHGLNKNCSLKESDYAIICIASVLHLMVTSELQPLKTLIIHFEQ